LNYKITQFYWLYNIVKNSIDLFIFCLFSDTFSGSDYVVLNNAMIIAQWFGRDVEEAGHGTEMNHENSQWEVSLNAQIWTQDLLNTKYRGECIPTLLNQLNLNETFTCNVLFYSTKLRIKINVEADLSRYCVTESWHKPWDKMIANKNIIPDVPRGDVVANFRLITSNGYLVTCDLLPPFIQVLCREDNATFNIDMLQNCTILNSGNTPSIVKLYWETEFLSSAWALNTITVGSRFTTGLCSWIFGCKSNCCKMSTI